VDAAASAERKWRARWDFRFFCETYFPHFVDAAVPPSKFQAHAYRLVPALLLQPGVRVPMVAPRGEGKSTLLVQLHALWRVCHRYSRYITLVMDAKEQGEMMLEAVKAELEANPRLQQDFAPICGKGKLWNSAKIITANDVMIEVFGAGKRIRGRRFGAHRPDLVLIDDLENDDLVRSKEQRDKREAWLRKVIGNLGPPDGSLVQLYVGTLLHADAVLARTLRNPLWKAHAQVFPSIHRWPDRMDLWDAWEDHLLNDGPDAAEQFYRAQRVEMETGAVVSWPEVRPLRVLMLLRAEDHQAFDTEHQHDPASGDGRPFNGCIQFWVQPCRDWVLFGAHDPSMGKHASRGDPAATLVGGYDRAHGVLDVIEALIARRAPDRQIEDIIQLQQSYPKLLLWGIESVAFQEFFRTELVKRSAVKGLHVPARAVMSSSDNDLRIESLQPHLANGLIRLHRNQRTLIAQLQHWPEADHDDGPDALEMLWQIARSGMVSVRDGVRVGRRKSAVDLAGYG
jgi:predicted phage terminase large subunit-like protein